MRISIFILERRRSGFWQTVAAPDKKRLDTIVGRRDRLGIVVIKAPFIVFFFASADLIRIRVNTFLSRIEVSALAVDENRLAAFWPTHLREMNENAAVGGQLVDEEQVDNSCSVPGVFQEWRMKSWLFWNMTMLQL